MSCVYRKAEYSKASLAACLTIRKQEATENTQVRAFWIPLAPQPELSLRTVDREEQSPPESLRLGS